MKILTAEEMRAVDRATAQCGIPGLILMENAGSRVVDFLQLTFAPLRRQRVVVFCGKGNNGGDGFVVARQLFTRSLAGELTVVEAFDPSTLSGDAAENRRMLAACGCPVFRSVPDSAWSATVVVDALLGTGLRGSASGPALEFIQLINRRFTHAKTVAIDIPSGLPSETTQPLGEYVRADHTVTFTAPKRSQCFSPSYEAMGRLWIVPIGTPDALCEGNDAYRLRLTTAGDLAPLFAARERNANKGLYGHVLVVGGSRGKPGAPAMSGLASLRMGAGLVTIATTSGGAGQMLAIAPELMTEAVPETASGFLSDAAGDMLGALAAKMTVVALGPGLGVEPETKQLVDRLYRSLDQPMVVDADGLNALAGGLPATKRVRILTPHPGEMGRLTGTTAAAVQRERLESAQQLAGASGATVVLKGDRTVIAFPQGETWINPTGSPSMATAGTGDILTGMVAGMVAQHPHDWPRAVVAAVWLHGRCGELGVAEWGEQSLVATDLLDFLPEAIGELRIPV